MMPQPGLAPNLGSLAQRLVLDRKIRDFPFLRSRVEGETSLALLQLGHKGLDRLGLAFNPAPATPPLSPVHTTPSQIIASNLYREQGVASWQQRAEKEQAAESRLVQYRVFIHSN